MKHQPAAVGLLVALIGVALLASRSAATIKVAEATAVLPAAGQAAANEESSLMTIRGDRLPRAAAGGDKDKENKAKKQQRKGKLAEFERECLESHNKWRRMHQAEALQFDEKIAAFARKRADFIAKSDGAEFRHPDDLIFGENLAWHSRNTTSCNDLIKMWYDEETMYDYTKAKFDKSIGHFTQLVWRSTTNVGCARAYSSGPKGGIYLVCNYDPPGNWLGEFGENVLKVASRAQPSMGRAIGAASSAAPISTRAPAASSLASTTTSSAPTSTSTSTSTSKRPKKSRKKKNKAKRNKKVNEKEEEERKRKEKGNKRKKGKGRKNKKNSTTTTTTTTSTTTTYRPEIPV